jgi:long-chain acyl-CoA synthetase
LKGRKKDLIVLANGQNVYPEDIEALLARHHGVRDAVVVGLNKEGGTVEVHAALLLDAGAQEEVSSIIRDVNSELAAHQQVQGCTGWPDEDFPRTHTLKVRKPLVIQRIHALQKGLTEQPITSSPLAEVSPLQRIVGELAHVRQRASAARRALVSILGWTLWVV